ncbi:hypothetical protein BYT27DRAFT_7250419 [Phlegmacium glaucopus]|nr:hypothetical protein BYT27DRAFT_7250419 [Phlegmacium glaucopus]
MPHCHVVIIGTVIIFTLVDSLFAQLSRQNSDNYLLQKFQLALEVYANSSSSKDFVVAVENAFSQSDSMLDADGDLFGIIMANPLIAEILSTN